jgi:ferric-dicitrate binding protein FerR (iron transport regulator)
MLKVSGVVTVNDLPAKSGQTILSGSCIVTASDSNSVLELGKFTRLVVAEQTELALDFSDAMISGSLRKGGVRAFIPAARALTILTPDGVVATDSSQAAVVSILVEDGGTRLSVESGRVELQTKNSVRSALAGETLTIAGEGLGGPPPQQNLNRAEKIGIIAGIGTGLAIILNVIIGRDQQEEEFGGCVIILSPIDGSPPCR